MTAARKVLRNIRTVESTVTRDVEVRLERPRVSVLSTHHYINLGGTEMVVYRVDARTTSSRGCGSATSSIRATLRPARGRGRHDQRSRRCAWRSSRCSTTRTVNTPMRVFARDAAGNTARADFDCRTFPKPFKKSRIELDDEFLDRVVPAILEGTTEVKPEGTRWRSSSSSTASCGGRTPRRSPRSPGRPRRRCCGAASCSIRSRNSAVESAFADQPHLHLSGQGGRPADAPRLRPGLVRRHAGGRRQPRQGPLRRGARDLRQLRDHRPRHGRAVALRPPLVDRREGRARWSRRNRRSAGAA